MKIDINELSHKISKLKQIVPKNSPMPVLQGILVQDGYLIANSIDIAMKAKIEGTEGESFIIPIKAFDILNNLPEGEVKITPENKGEYFSIVIETDRIKNRYQTMNPSAFPLPDIGVDDGEKFTISADTFLSSVKRVAFAISIDKSKRVLSSMYLKAENGTLDFVGSNGYVAAWDKVDFDGNFKLLIPKEAVDRLLSIGISGEVSITHSKNGAVFTTDEYELHTRVTNGEYIDYIRMFKDLSIHTAVSKSELLDAMIRTKMCRSEKTPAIFYVKDNKMDITLKDSITEYRETINLRDNAREIRIGFDSRFVAETLKAFSCENVVVEFENPHYPMIIKSESGTFKTMVMAVMI